MINKIHDEALRASTPQFALSYEIPFRSKISASTKSNMGVVIFIEMDVRHRLTPISLKDPIGI
jgi:hypothetical protein